MQQVKISAVIITFNEEKNIKRCLDSLVGIADEVVVVDSFSTDKTEEIALSQGARVIRKEFDGFTQQKQFAVKCATYDVILALDADEVISSDLKASLLKLKYNWTADAVTFNRLNHFKEKPIKSCGWYPDAKIRMWDRSKGNWTGGLLHEIVQMNQEAKVIHVEGDLRHYAYKDVDGLLNKIQQYSAIYAEEHAFKKHVTSLGIIVKTVGAFFKNYFVKGGIADGFEGLVVSISNTMGVFYKYAKLKERNNSISTSLIVTTYNRVDALAVVLLSIKKQIRIPDEVIVADDGSREETAQLVRDFAKEFPVPLVHVWHEDIGFRLSMIRNKAIARARGEYIIMIDGDMVLPPRFILDHVRHARHGRYIQGSRVLLSQKLTHEFIEGRRTSVSFFTKGLENRKNTLYSHSLSRFFSFYSKSFFRIRGANLSFWRTDIVQVNGFNEDFEGWGREDSEFAVRMLYSGTRRFHLKFQGFAYHLCHSENSREMLSKNERVLELSIENRLIRCKNGLDKYLVQKIR